MFVRQLSLRLVEVDEVEEGAVGRIPIGTKAGRKEGIIGEIVGGRRLLRQRPVWAR